MLLALDDIIQCIQGPLLFANIDEFYKIQKLLHELAVLAVDMTMVNHVHHMQDTTEAQVAEKR